MRWHHEVTELDWATADTGPGIWRPGYPPSFFHRLGLHGIGAEAQRICDLGTGTGVLAREFAKRGCRVTGVDLEPALLTAARELAGEERVEVTWICAPAEVTGLPSRAFDLVTASEAWSYFDEQQAVPEVLRLLAPGGRLLTCHLSWLPGRDPLAERSERLLLDYNPAWAGAGWDGTIRPRTGRLRDHFDVTAMFFYDEPMPFTRESWRGRLRASRGVQELPPADIAAFDAEHAALLERTAPARFTVLHRLDATIYTPR